MNTTNFKTLVLKQDGDAVTPAIEKLALSDLMDGDVVVEVHYSSVNYKDALALANKGIIRKFPAVPGIDLAGVVLQSGSSKWKSGDEVVLTGWGIGERHWGGYSEIARVNGDWLTALPKDLTLKDAMAVGTAGLTAMLSVLALEHHGLHPQSGPVLVTGAAGGVGSVAVAILAKLGYEVWAMTGRSSQEEFLKNLGASKVVSRTEFTDPAKNGRPGMEKEVFASVVDTVGGNLLADLLARVKYGGAVTACGLVAGVNVDTTVYPFILRGVSLLGIDSVRCPQEKRIQAWGRLSQDLPIDKLRALTHEIALEGVPEAANKLLNGQGLGRTVVKLSAS